MGFPLEGQARQVSRLGIHRLAHWGCVFLSSPWFWVSREGGWCLRVCRPERRSLQCGL